MYYRLDPPPPPHRPRYGPRPLKSTGRHWHFLNATSDIGPWNMRHGGKTIGTRDIAFSWMQHVTMRKISDSDMRHCHFLKSTHWGPPLNPPPLKAPPPPPPTPQPPTPPRCVGPKRQGGAESAACSTVCPSFTTESYDWVSGDWRITQRGAWYRAAVNIALSGSY